VPRFEVHKCSRCWTIHAGVYIPLGPLRAYIMKHKPFRTLALSSLLYILMHAYFYQSLYTCHKRTKMAVFGQTTLYKHIMQSMVGCNPLQCLGQQPPLQRIFQHSTFLAYKFSRVLRQWMRVAILKSIGTGRYTATDIRHIVLLESTETLNGSCY